jgi:xanthine dehydrogenase accessory factor
VTARLTAAAAVPHVRAALEGGPPVAGVAVLSVDRLASPGETERPTSPGETERATSPAGEAGDADRPASPTDAGESDGAASLATGGGDGDRPASPARDGDGPRTGDHLLVWADRHAGTLGDPALDGAAVAEARAMLAGGRPGTRTLEAGGWRCTAYVEAYHPPPALVIVGAGHIARPLCRVGAMLGFRVTVLDDRPEFATRERFPEAAEVRRADFTRPFDGVRIDGGTHLVLVTRGHKYDFEALRDVLARPEAPRYVGMVGSRRRVRATLEQLRREGVGAERLRAVHAPVGLDVGAETPEEIAVAIAAEIVLVRRGGTGTPLRDRARVVDRWVEPRGADRPTALPGRDGEERITDEGER